MNTAVGIDISKGKVWLLLCDRSDRLLCHRASFRTQMRMSAMAESLRLIDGNTRVILEATGRYHESVVVALREAGIFVSIVNPKLIKKFCNSSLRKVKTDKVG